MASYILDNAWETDNVDPGWGKNMRLHHNLLLQCMTGPISQQYGNGKARRKGPVHVYRNVVIGYDYYGWNGSVIKGVGTMWENGYRVFNNTFWVKTGGLASLVGNQTSRDAQHSVWYLNKCRMIPTGPAPAEPFTMKRRLRDFAMWMVGADSDGRCRSGNIAKDRESKTRTVDEKGVQGR